MKKKIDDIIKELEEIKAKYGNLETEGISGWNAHIDVRDYFEYFDEITQRADYAYVQVLDEGKLPYFIKDDSYVSKRKRLVRIS